MCIGMSFLALIEQKVLFKIYLKFSNYDKIYLTKACGTEAKHCKNNNKDEENILRRINNMKSDVLLFYFLILKVLSLFKLDYCSHLCCFSNYVKI